MANTYTQLYVHLVFAVRGRESLISEAIRERVQQYLGGIVRELRHKLLAIYCMPDHTHLFLSMHPDQSVSDLVRDLKSSSSTWLNEQRLVRHHFEWQRGYGAFSYAKSQIDNVVKYILRQPEHHLKVTFQQEYVKLLVSFGIDYDERYLFDWGKQEE